MWLKIDLNGIVLHLQIKDYKPSKHEIWDEQWCRTDYSFASEPWLNYQKTSDEVFLSCEVEQLAGSIQKLLHDELVEITEIECVEPDFRFVLHPKRDLRNDPKYTYIAPGYEIEDIYMEWTVAFWNDGLTDNFLSVTLYRCDLEYLLIYLNLITGSLKRQNTIIADLIDKGIIYGD